MTAAEFKNGIMDWLKKNKIEDNVSELIFNDTFYFDWANNTVAIGVNDLEDAGKWFEEFLIDRGMEWTGILSPVLGLLHEVGHSKTVYTFDETRRFMCRVLKDLLGPTNESKDASFDYWNIEDEAAANDWVISFVNEHIAAVEELCQYFIDNWEDSLDDVIIEAEKMSV